MLQIFTGIAATVFQLSDKVNLGTLKEYDFAPQTRNRVNAFPAKSNKNHFIINRHLKKK